MQHQQYVLIVAGGSGTRMGAGIPKQFLQLNGQPLMMHTIDVFAKTLPGAVCIVVLPENQIEFWQKLCKDFAFTVPHQIVFGGDTRFQSVQNGLNKIESKEGVVAIHDAVRPFVTGKIILNCVQTATEMGNAIPVTDCIDSVRMVNEKGGNAIVDRTALKLVQTPQCFDVLKIKNAYTEADKVQKEFTDDASVLEFMGEKINLVSGDAFNIKITTPFDLELGKLILMNK